MKRLIVVIASIMCLIAFAVAPSASAGRFLGDGGNAYYFGNGEVCSPFTLCGWQVKGRRSGDSINYWAKSLYPGGCYSVPSDIPISWNDKIRHLYNRTYYYIDFFVDIDCNTAATHGGKDTLAPGQEKDIDFWNGGIGRAFISSFRVRKPACERSSNPVNTPHVCLYENAGFSGARSPLTVPRFVKFNECHPLGWLPLVRYKVSSIANNSGYNVRLYRTIERTGEKDRNTGRDIYTCTNDFRVVPKGTSVVSLGKQWSDDNLQAIMFAN